MLPAKFTLDDAERAYEEWGANCGPGALAAALGKTLDEVRPHLVGFEQKRYTNPTMMFGALNTLGARWSGKHQPIDMLLLPAVGLIRVQWEGPWLKPGVPKAAAYGHTHWIAIGKAGDAKMIFDINCICDGGWVPWEEWSGEVAPWLIKESQPPRAYGTWHFTHVIAITQ